MNKIIQKLILYLLISLTITPYAYTQQNDLTGKKGRDEFWLIRPVHPSGHGFFSSFNLVLGHIYLFEKKAYNYVKGIKIDFGNEGNYYSPEYGSNWWEYYFEPLTLGRRGKTPPKPSPGEANQVAWATRRRLTRNEAGKILHTHIKIKNHIINIVNDFTSRNFKGYMIGVHYRGTDKSVEAPRVNYDDVICAISDQIEILGTEDYNLFVATDELAFLKYIQELFPGKVTATEATRSSGSANVHSGSVRPYEIGEEALVDAILLSKCDLLIRTSSNLSLWSTYYNTEIPEILLNQRYGYPAE